MEQKILKNIFSSNGVEFQVLAGEFRTYLQALFCLWDLMQGL